MDLKKYIPMHKNRSVVKYTRKKSECRHMQKKNTNLINF